VYVERLPFSFAGLFSLAPAAGRCEPKGPIEPYDIRVWSNLMRKSGRHHQVQAFWSRAGISVDASSMH
jgi:hypothetical protein